MIAIGDRISKTSKITVGSEAISKIRELRVDLCFMGVNAINLNTGISDNDWDIVQAAVCKSRNNCDVAIKQADNSNVYN